MSGALSTISDAMRWKLGLSGTSGCASRPSRRAKSAELFIASRCDKSIRIDEMSLDVAARLTPPRISARLSRAASRAGRQEENTYALQSLKRISSATFCIKKQKNIHNMTTTTISERQQVHHT